MIDFHSIFNDIWNNASVMSMFECWVNSIKTREVSLVYHLPLSKARRYIEKKLRGFPRHYTVDKALATILIALMISVNLYVQEIQDQKRLYTNKGTLDIYDQLILERENYGTGDPERQADNLQVSRNSMDVVVPGIGVVYQVTDYFSLFTGIQKGFSPPTPGSTRGTDTTKELLSTNYYTCVLI